MTSTNTCSCCAEPVEMNRLPLDYSFGLPDELIMVVMQQQGEQIKQPNSALASAGSEHFYVRGLVELPVLGTEETLAWGAWMSVLKEDYEKCLKAWSKDTAEERMVNGHVMGLLANTFPELYPDALNLQVAGCDRVGMAMKFILEPTDHPLSLEQYNGITVERVHEIARHMGVKQ